MRTMSLIELSNITKRFRNITALDHISLSVEDGEYVCILGPSGAGKTTLLRIIAGLLAPDEGEIIIEGKPVNNLPPEERNAVYMFQRYALFPYMTVWQNVSFGPTIKDWDEDKTKETVSNVLEMVKLTERADALPSELSGGMQQRVALARGIASGFRILLLDEPLGALDARLRVDIRSQLRKLAKDQNLTVIHVTHDQEEALMIADRIIVLRNGIIEQSGAPQKLYLRPQSIFIAGFVGGANFIEGYVVKVDKSEAFIEMRGGLLIHLLRGNSQVGERTVVAFRPEDTHIGSEQIAGSNNFYGRLESATFIGDSMKYVVRLDNGISLTSKILLPYAPKGLRVNERVVVSFPPDECFLFPYPEAGLLKETEAI